MLNQRFTAKIHKTSLLFVVYFICLCSVFTFSETEAADQWVDGDNVFSYYARDAEWTSEGTIGRTMLIKVNNQSGATINSRMWTVFSQDGEWYYSVYGLKGADLVSSNRLAEKILDYMLTLR